MAVIAKDSLPASVRAERNLVYASLPHTPYGKRNLHADIFRPKKAGRFPAVIMIHGGGWRSGTRSMQVPMAEMLAAKGFVTITAEYQLSLEAGFPAAVYNIKAAIRWLRLHGEKYQIDTSQMAIFGCSAGGQLAALVGLSNGVKSLEGTQGVTAGKSHINAIIDIDGVINFMAPASLDKPRKINSADVSWLGGNFEQRPAVWKAASAAYWANKQTAIPMLFINSGFSRFHAGQDELIGMMKEWGIYTAVHKFDVQMHPFWLFHPWVDITVDYTTTFLRKVFQ